MAVDSTYLSGLEKGLPLKELRKRILKIAASYVGQTTYGTRSGFNDGKFEQRIKKVGWSKGLHYCNFTVRMIWYEAMGPGNNIVPATTAHPGSWTETQRKINLELPVDTRGGTTLPDYKYGYYRPKYGAQDPTVTGSRLNYTKLMRFVSVTNNPTYKTGKGSSKNKGSSSNAKELLGGGYVLPGDAITFNWAPGSNPRFSNHIGIYLGPANSSYSKIFTIEGNCSAHGKNGVWLKTRNISVVDGFCQLRTRDVK